MLTFLSLKPCWVYFGVLLECSSDYYVCTGFHLEIDTFFMCFIILCSLHKILPNLLREFGWKAQGIEWKWVEVSRDRDKKCRNRKELVN